MEGIFRREIAKPRWLRQTALVIFAFSITAYSLPSHAQKPETSATAPVPIQLSAAKKVFLANNASEHSMTSLFGYDRDRAYNDVYAGLKQWGQVELVATPEEADVVAELQLLVVTDPPDVMGGSSSPGGFDLQLRLIFWDARSHFVLWGLTEHGGLGGLKKQRVSKYQAEIELILEDAKAILRPSAPSTKQ